MPRASSGREIGLGRSVGATVGEGAGVNSGTNVGATPSPAAGFTFAHISANASRSTIAKTAPRMRCTRPVSRRPARAPARLPRYGAVAIVMLPLELNTMICGPPPPTVNETECGCAAKTFAIAGSTVLVTVPCSLNASMLALTP